MRALRNTARLHDKSKGTALKFLLDPLVQTKDTNGGIGSLEGFYPTTETYNGKYDKDVPACFDGLDRIHPTKITITFTKSTGKVTTQLPKISAEGKVMTVAMSHDDDLSSENGALVASWIKAAAAGGPEKVNVHVTLVVETLAFRFALAPFARRQFLRALKYPTSVILEDDGSPEAGDSASEEEEEEEEEDDAVGSPIDHAEVAEAAGYAAAAVGDDAEDDDDNDDDDDDDGGGDDDTSERPKPPSSVGLTQVTATAKSEFAVKRELTDEEATARRVKRKADAERSAAAKANQPVDGGSQNCPMVFDTSSDEEEDEDAKIEKKKKKMAMNIEAWQLGDIIAEANRLGIDVPNCLKDAIGGDQVSTFYPGIKSLTNRVEKELKALSVGRKAEEKLAEYARLLKATKSNPRPFDVTSYVGVPWDATVKAYAFFIALARLRYEPRKSLIKTIASAKITEHSLLG